MREPCRSRSRDSRDSRGRGKREPKRPALDKVAARQAASCNLLEDFLKHRLGAFSSLSRRRDAHAKTGKGVIGCKENRAAKQDPGIARQGDAWADRQ